MDFTREELENADLLLVVDKDGRYKYSSHRSDQEISNVLASISRKIMGEPKSLSERIREASAEAHNPHMEVYLPRDKHPLARTGVEDYWGEEE